MPALVNKGAGEPNPPVNLRIISKSPILEINSHNHLKKKEREMGVGGARLQVVLKGGVVSLVFFLFARLPHVHSLLDKNVM